MCGPYAIPLPPEAVRQWFQTYGEIPNWAGLRQRGADHRSPRGAPGPELPEAAQ